MNRVSGWVVVACLVMIAGAAVRGDGARAADEHMPSAEAGRALAEKLCKTCHLIGAEGDGSAQVGPPPFKSIADKPGQTFEHIKKVLIRPHAPMPDMHLTNDEILDLVAYLDSLRDAGSTPLLPPVGGKLEVPRRG
jgi:cytochrome c